MDRLPTDIIYTILSEYIPIPWICKSVYNICHINNSVYKKYRRDILLHKFFNNPLIDCYVNKISDYETMISYNPTLIHHVRDISYELAKLAVSKNGSIIGLIPDDVITDELIDIAVTNCGSMLRVVPFSTRTYDLCMKAVSNDPFALAFVPKHHMTYNLCIVAVSKNGEALKDVPLRLIDQNMVYIAISSNGMALQYRYNVDVTDDMYYKAVASNPLAIQFIPKHLITSDMAKDVVSKNPLTIRYIPHDLLTYDMYHHCLFVCNNNSTYKTVVNTILKYIPDEERYKELMDMTSTLNNPADINPLYNITQYIRSKYNRITDGQLYNKIYDMDPSLCVYLKDNYLDVFVREFKL